MTFGYGDTSCLGSILRVPIGYWTNRHGARNVSLISFILLLFPFSILVLLNTFTDLLIGGLFIGISGAIFSARCNMHLPKILSKREHGFVNGIYGMGNIGTALTTFSPPVIANQLGWRTTVQIFAILVIAVVAITFLSW